MPFARGDDASFDDPRVVRDLPHAASRQVVQPIRLALGIDEGFEGDRPCLEEGVEILRRSLADDDDTGTLIGELVVMVAQLRDVPAAERSPVMAEEDEDHRLLGPKGCEARGRAVQGDDLGVGRALTNRGMHMGERTGAQLGPRNGGADGTLTS